jgi:hypothetical protein
VTPSWYQFGLALGVDKGILSKYSKCPQEESLVEVADYWLRNSPTKPTWRDVAQALKKIGLDSLANDILLQNRLDMMTICGTCTCMHAC